MLRKIPLLLLILVLLAPIAAPAAAQGEAVCYDYLGSASAGLGDGKLSGVANSFTESYGYEQAPAPTYNVGATRFDAGFNNYESAWTYALTLVWDFGEPVRIVSIDYRYQVQFGELLSRRQAINHTANSLINVLWQRTGSNYTGETVFLEPEHLVTDKLYFNAAARADDEDQSGYARVSFLRVCVIEEEEPPAADWIRPFEEAQEIALYTPLLSDSLLDTGIDTITTLCDLLDLGYEQVEGKPYCMDYPESVFAWSADPDAHVLAATGGLVTRVEAFTQDVPCDGPFVYARDLCAVALPADFTDDDTLRVYDFSTASLYWVTIETTAGYLSYLVRDADDFVDLGDTIEAGCILGRAVVPVILNWEITILPPSIGYSLEPIDDGFTVMRMSAIDSPRPEYDYGLAPSPMIDVYSLLGLYGFAWQACNLDPALSSCLGDSELDRPEDWTSTNGVQWTNEGATLPQNDAISQQLLLDIDASYSVAVTLEVLPGGTDQVVTVGIGDTAQDFTLLPATGSDQQVIVPAAQHNPDLGLFYTVYVSNPASSTVLIKTVCVAEGESYAPSPGSCYFQDPSFEGIPLPWTLDGGTTEGVVNGEILVPDEGTFAQEVDWSPAAAIGGTYYPVTIETALWFVPSADIPDDDFTSYVLIEYNLDGAGWVAIPNSQNSQTNTAFALYVRNETGEVQFRADIPVSVAVQGTLEFRVTLSTTNADVLGVKVREVCARHETEGTTPVDPFRPECRVITPPSGEQLSRWVNYHWLQLDRFFKCDLMVVLNRIWNTTQSIFQLIGWVTRYWISTIYQWSDWLASDLFPYLSGHFANIANGRVTNIEGGGAGFWHALVALFNGLFGLLTAAISPLADAIAALVRALAGIIDEVLLEIINALLNFVMLLISSLLNLLGIGLGFLGGLIASWNNATPTPLPGMWDCSVNPQSQPMCIVLYAAEHTIFSGTGQYLLGIIIGWGWSRIILFVLGYIKSMMIKAGSNA